MHNKYRFTFLLFTIPFSLFLISWGYNGHHIINGNTSLSFTPEMQQFQSWALTLAEHASDADDRKDIDPYESPRHYIDIDNYAEFLATGKIPSTYDSVVALHGTAFVIDQGILPYATRTTYDSLVASFARFDWQKAVLYASDLGHYVGDAHNPLHITRNYDGDYTGNSGIHSRYETGMINAFKDQITMTGHQISVITDVNGYIFSYIYANYIYVDSIMLADDYAKGVAGNTSSYQYKSALWEKCGGFTIPLFNNAAKALAELIYSAWVQAGKPDMNSGPGIFEFVSHVNDVKLHVSPNPVNGMATISFDLKAGSDARMQVYDIHGAVIKTLMDKKLPAGEEEFSFDLSGLPAGIYFISLEAGNCKGVCKFIYSDL